MKTLHILIALVVLALPCLAATDSDLLQKSSAQVRAIATELRKEVGIGRKNLDKAEEQIRNLDQYGRDQWQRAENEKRAAVKWRGRVLAAFAAGALGGAIAVALAVRSKAPSADVPVRRVRAPKPKRSTGKRK